MDANDKISGKAAAIIMSAVIVLQVLFVTYFFVFVKEGTHSDEPWSYGLANSYYEPFIYGEELYDSGSKLNHWTDGSIFSDYLTVQEDERFSYGSVWYNQSIDMHPPFYFAILHTICSFFPDTFSRVYAYIINIAAMVVGQIFLYRSANRLCKSRLMGMITCCFWGFSIAFVHSNIFLRMYSPLTMFTIIFGYYHVRLYRNEGSLKSNLIKLAIVTFLGALTQHYFLIFAFAMAACFCFYYLFKKQFKMMFAYAGTVAGAVGLSIAAFPAAIQHMFFMDSTEQRLENSMPFFNGFRSCLHLIVNSLTGIKVSVYSTGSYAYAVVAVVLIAAVLLPLSFLFRNEEWFKRFKRSVRSGVKYFFKHIDFMFIFLLISITFTCVIVAVTVNLNVMELYSDRYLFLVMPWAAMCMVLAVKYLIGLLKPLKRFTAPITAVLACFAVVSSFLVVEMRYTLPRFIRGEGGIETTVSANTGHIVVITQGWQLVTYAERLLGCEDLFVTTINSMPYNLTAMSEYDEDKDWFILIDATAFQNVLDFKARAKNDNENFKFNVPDNVFADSVTEEEYIDLFENDIFPGKKLQFYSSESVYGSSIHVYHVVPESEYQDIPVTDVRMEEMAAREAVAAVND